MYIARYFQAAFCNRWATFLRRGISNAINGSEDHYIQDDSDIDIDYTEEDNKDRFDDIDELEFFSSGN